MTDSLPPTPRVLQLRPYQERDIAAVRKSKRAHFLAHRRELIDQCYSKLLASGVPPPEAVAAHGRSRGWTVVAVSAPPGAPSW